MNIDLLRTKGGQFGLVADTAFQSPPRAALLDSEQGILSLEFGEDDGFMCNVPIVEDWRDKLLYEDSLLIGSVVGGVVHSADRIPLKVLS